jgi:hypothetical protein
LTPRATSLLRSYHDKYAKAKYRLLHVAGLGRLSRTANPPAMLTRDDYRPLLKLVRVMGGIFKVLAKEATERQLHGTDKDVIKELRDGYARLAKLLRRAIQKNQRSIILGRTHRHEHAVMCQMVQTFRTPVQNHTLRREAVVERGMFTDEEWKELFGKSTGWLRLCR